MPYGKAITKTEIKRSVFIALCKAVESEEEAAALLEETAKEHYKANHNCYAYIIGTGVAAKRFSDDGEPSGTAGRPILSVLEACGLTNVICIVTRYFGGIKLGASGLLRAYSEAASKSVNAVGVIKKLYCVSYLIKCDYAFYQKMVNYTAANGLNVENAEFAETVNMYINVPFEKKDKFADDIIQLSSGVYRAEPVCEKYEDITEKRND